MTPLDVAIVGCGTAGPAAALFLLRAGHRVTVYERVPRPGPVGAGIVLQPTGMAVLAALGLLDEVLARGAVLRELYCESAVRRPVVHLRYADLAADLYGLGLHRGVLFQTLYAALLSDPGAAARLQLHLGVEVTAVERRGPRQALHLRTADGARLGPHDLLIVADGARSQLRDDGLHKQVTRYPWGALWYVARDEERHLSGFLGARLYQVVDGTRRLLGLLPTGLGPRPADRAEPAAGPDVPLVSLFYSVRIDDVPALRAAGLLAWKAEVRRLAPAADAVLGSIRSIDQLLLSEYSDVVMERWHGRDVVYLGDAAHAMSPQLGQGCNLALVDAAVLAASLAAHDRVADALAAYSRARRSHLGYYQLATRWLTPLFQSDHAWLGPPRDLLMGLTCRLPWFRTQMLTGMAGVSRGPLLPPLPLGSRPPALPALR
ncbi:MAG: NAD(P)/FAD-dependent oxidoreductase [Polyangia bacterium]